MRPAASTADGRNDGRARAAATVLAAATALLSSRVALGQATGALERFQPSPSGDALFGVASPAVGGHLVARGTAIFDFAYRPLSIQDGTTRDVIVSRQGTLHLDASLALWDRLLVSVDMPMVLVQAGDSPTVDGVAFLSPSGVQAGDLRLGARARIYGGYWDAFQIGAGGYVWAPTAPSQSYAGDGKVRGEPQIQLGGRVRHFVWSATVGTELRASTHPGTLEAGAGAAVVLGEELVQLGPELTVTVPFSTDRSFSTPAVTITSASPTGAELLLGAKVRPLRALVLGAGAGPGLTHGYGTPVWFAVGSIGYEPLPPRPDKVDTDGDGIPDVVDACPTVRGVHSQDPHKNGCPPVEDRDGDGIPDATDACPTVPGVRSEDPRKNGCPLDTDEDGIPDAEDACPTEKGSRDPDPRQNGCPHVRVTATEIVITKQVYFLFARSQITQTVDPVSNDLLTEVLGAINQHPEIELIEVQGHTDNVGTDHFNMVLSQARADAVRQWLVTRGVAGKKLIAKGYGSHVPQASSDTEEGRRENRRVQFKIIVHAKKAP